MNCLDELERNDYFERNLFLKAREDSLVTGDRFVPGCRGDHDSKKLNWCVIDTHREEITEHGLAFDVALDHAEWLSRLDRLGGRESGCIPGC